MKVGIDREEFGDVRRRVGILSFEDLGMELFSLGFSPYGFGVFEQVYEGFG